MTWTAVADAWTTIGRSLAAVAATVPTTTWLLAVAAGSFTLGALIGHATRPRRARGRHSR